MYDKILNAVYESLDDINEQLSLKNKLVKSKDTILFGQIDSLGLVTLIVMTEEKIEDEFNKSIVLADERAMSQRNSPFRTVGTFVDYIYKLLEGNTNDWQTCYGY